MDGFVPVQGVASLLCKYNILKIRKLVLSSVVSCNYIGIVYQKNRILIMANIMAFISGS